jgi:hypothetical protein
MCELGLQRVNYLSARRRLFERHSPGIYPFAAYLFRCSL